MLPGGGGGAGVTVKTAGELTAGASPTRDIDTANCAPLIAVVIADPGIFNVDEFKPTAVAVCESGRITAQAYAKAPPLLAAATTVNVAGCPATTATLAGCCVIVMVTLVGGGVGASVPAPPPHAERTKRPARTPRNAIVLNFMVFPPPA